MIDTDKPSNFYECFCDQDDCYYTIYGNGDFLAAIDRMKQLGWGIKKIGDKSWQHLCSVHNTYQPKIEPAAEELPF